MLINKICPMCKKNAFLELFHLLSDTSFVDYLEKCEKALTKTLRQPHRKAQEDMEHE